MCCQYLAPSLKGAGTGCDKAGGVRRDVWAVSDTAFIMIVSIGGSSMEKMGFSAASDPATSRGVWRSSLLRPGPWFSRSSVIA